MYDYDNRPTWIRFEEFHAANPSVYNQLVVYAFEAKRADRKKTSITLLVNRVRWYFDFEIEANCKFRINDHYSPYYARLLMAEYPELEGVFEVRTSEADLWIENKLAGELAA